MLAGWDKFLRMDDSVCVVTEKTEKQETRQRKLKLIVPLVFEYNWTEM